jgi:hypothetical protein
MPDTGTACKPLICGKFLISLRSFRKLRLGKPGAAPWKRGEQGCRADFVAA